MIVTVASFKGGVGKTTTAVHLAGYLHTLAPTLLLDGDQTRNATAWCARGRAEAGEPGVVPFPFRVAAVDLAPKLARQYEHLVIDLGQRPADEDLAAAAEGCDLLVVPAVPSSLDSDGLGQTLRALQKLEAANYRVLLTKVAPDAAHEAAELRELLAGIAAPTFAVEIPRLKAFEKAAASGQLVRDVDDRNAARAWAAYELAGRELA